jgi:hypothetical protein
MYDPIFAAPASLMNIEDVPATAQRCFRKQRSAEKLRWVKSNQHLLPRSGCSERSSPNAGGQRCRAHPLNPQLSTSPAHRIRIFRIRQSLQSQQLTLRVAQMLFVRFSWSFSLVHCQFPGTLLNLLPLFRAGLFRLLRRCDTLFFLRQQRLPPRGCFDGFPGNSWLHPSKSPLLKSPPSNQSVN